METEATAATLLAVGNEAMLEAAFRTGDFAAAEETLNAAEVDGEAGSDAAAGDTAR
jgi:hypothetical protein